MNIEYISTYSMPSQRAVGVQIMNTCEAFAKVGNRVRLWFPKRDKGFDPTGIFSFYGIDRIFEVVPVFLRGFGRRKIGHFLSILLYFWKLKRMIPERGSIIYSREQIAGIFFPRFVFEVHYLPTHVTIFHRLLWRRASCFVVVTAFLKEKLVSLGYDAEKVHVAHDAISDRHLHATISKTEARKKLGLPRNQKIIGYVGKYKTPFSKGKGVEELIKAFPKVLRRIPDAFLLLVGIDSASMEEVRSTIQRAGIDPDCMSVMSHVPQAAVIEYLRSADVLVMNYPWSDYAAYQMSPMKLFEYMAAKRPIVASCLPSILEIIDETCSFLITPDNEESLVDGIIQVFQDEPRAQRIADSAYDRVRSHTWETRTRGISGFLKAISV